jgi:thioredoxin-related protein
MKSLLITLILLVNITSFAQETGMNIEHDATWQQILDKAKKENKFILLDAYASWCGPCKWMAKEIFPLKEVGAAINPYFINAKIDMEKGEGIELAKKYDVRSYPTYLFFDSNGNLVHRGLGSMPAGDFITLCSNALNPNKQYITLQKEYLSGNRDTSFLKNFVIESLNNQDSLYKPAMIEYLTLRKTIEDYDVEFVYYCTSNLHDTTFTIIQNNLEKFNRIIGKEKIDALIEELVWNEAKIAGKKGKDKVAFKSVIEKYLLKKTNMLCAQYDLSILKRAGSWSAYLPKAEKFANDFCQNDWERLNDIANNLLEHYTSKSTLQKGLKIALHSVEVKANYINLLTTAQIYQKINDYVNARQYADKALDITASDSEERKEVEAFINSLK